MGFSVAYFNLLVSMPRLGRRASKVDVKEIAGQAEVKQWAINAWSMCSGLLREIVIFLNILKHSIREQCEIPFLTIPSKQFWTIPSSANPIPRRFPSRYESQPLKSNTWTMTYNAAKQLSAVKRGTERKILILFIFHCFALVWFLSSFCFR